MPNRVSLLFALATLAFGYGCDGESDPDDGGADAAGDTSVVSDSSPMDGASDTTTPTDTAVPTDTARDTTLMPPPIGAPTWVAVGNWGFRSSTTDGVTWATTMNPDTGDDHSPDLLRDVSWGDGWFVAVGGDRNSMVMRSSDGVAWEEDLHPPGMQWKGGVVYGDGRWVAVGGVGTVIHSDDDAATWMDNTDRLPSAGRNIAHGGGQFVAVGDGGMIAVSADGLTWADHTQSGAVRLGGVGYGHGTWVVTGSQWNGSGFDTSCFTSSDAAAWAPCTFSASRFDGVFFTDGLLIVSTGEGYESTGDGTTWTHSDISIPSSVFHADGLFVGVSGDRRYHGPALDDLMQIDDATRGARSFTLGYVGG